MPVFNFLFLLLILVNVDAETLLALRHGNCTQAECGNNNAALFCREGSCVQIRCNTSDQCPRLPYAPEDLCYIGTCVDTFCIALDCLELNQICISNTKGCGPLLGITGPPPPPPANDNNQVVIGLSFTTIGLILLICCILLAFDRFTGRRGRSVV